MTAIASINLREVLGEWDLIPDRVRRISTGGNVHWRVQRGVDAFVLRRYRRGQTTASIRYEFDVLGQLHAHGWPVAAPIDDVRWHQGVAFALFPFLPGRARTGETTRHQRDRGRILAALHRDLDSLTLHAHGQRDGWQRADLVVLAEQEWVTRFAAADRSTSWPPAILHAVMAHWRGTHDRLASTRPGRFPAMVVHGDLVAHNLRFQHGQLSGVLDLDSTHLDLRAADVACARRSGADGKGDDVVRGYLETGALSDAEGASLDDLWRAAILRYAAQLLDGTTATRGPAAEALAWCVGQLDKTRPFDMRR